MTAGYSLLGCFSHNVTEVLLSRIHIWSIRPGLFKLGVAKELNGGRRILDFNFWRLPWFWEKNSEIQQQIEVKTFFFFREHLDFGSKIGKSEIKSK